MVFDNKALDAAGNVVTVLILVLVEDGLWLTCRKSSVRFVTSEVLILVLVEDGLWPHLPKWWKQQTAWVLILVLVEDGLWLFLLSNGLSDRKGLNPCFNGRWSLTLVTVLICLRQRFVLILVLMEDGLWRILTSKVGRNHVVLILVLMEDGLWPCTAWNRVHFPYCLNPCFNGRWSLTVVSIRRHPPQRVVLILVLMEDGLWR